MAAPTVTSVAPATGSTLGGTLVNIFGSGFLVSAPQVFFGTALASQIVVQGDGFLSAISPPNVGANTVNITVQTSAGTSATSSADLFAYAFPLPDAADYTNECPYLDLFANYTFYGQWTFALPPIGTGGGGGASWLLAGNTGAGHKFGSLDANDVVMYADNTEIARLVSATGAFQIASNATIGGGGGFPASLITGIDPSGSLVMTATPLGGGGTPTGAAVLLGGATNSVIMDAVVLLSPSSGTLFITDITVGPFAGVFAQGLILGHGDPSNFGNATGNVITMLNQTVNPTTVGSGFGTIFVGTDNNLYFLNNTATYQLTPPSGAASWNLTGTNSGAGLLLGTNTTDGFSIRQNSVNFITLTTSTLSIATNLSVTALNIGNTNLIVSESADNWTNTTVISYSIDSPVVNVGATPSNASVSIGNVAGSTVGISGVTFDVFFTGAMDLEAEGGTTICTSVGGTLVIGNPALSTTIDATTLMLANLPAATGGEQMVMWDPTTGQLRHT